MLYALLFAVAFDAPDALPDCLPDSATIEVPVTAEVAPARTWGILRWIPGPCPTCPATPEYGWLETPDVDAAARRLERWRELPRETVKKLERIVDAPARAKHWSPGSCGMLGCQSHPGREVYDDEESQAETDARTVPWPSGGIRRFFGRRR